MLRSAIRCLSTGQLRRSTAQIFRRYFAGCLRAIYWLRKYRNIALVVFSLYPPLPHISLLCVGLFPTGLNSSPFSIVMSTRNHTLPAVVPIIAFQDMPLVVPAALFRYKSMLPTDRFCGPIYKPSCNVAFSNITSQRTTDAIYRMAAAIGASGQLVRLRGAAGRWWRRRSSGAGSKVIVVVVV